MELDSEPSELNYEGGEEPIYDSHQREKSTGSGLVLAVPAMVLDPEDTEHEAIRAAHRGAGVVISGGEYENLVADNQYYEQVEFGKLGRQASAVMEDSLYSIPQVVSSNNSTTGLTTNMAKVKLGYLLQCNELHTITLSGKMNWSVTIVIYGIIMISTRISSRNA